MMWFPGGGWWMGITMLVFWAGVTVLIVWAIRGLGTTQSPPERSTRRALDILEQRFARGEIDTAEFEERRSLLEER